MQWVQALFVVVGCSAIAGRVLYRVLRGDYDGELTRGRR